jgi:hypothetical protein
MAAKKKPDLAVVIGMGKPKGGAEEEAPPESEREEADEESAYHDAFHELASALGVDPKMTDAAKGAEAFKTLHDLCASEYGEESGEEE